MSLYRHEFAVCPWCEDETGSRVDHLYGGTSFRTFGPWYCDKCHRGFRGKINAPGDVTITRDTDDQPKWARCFVLLKRDDLFLVMDTKRYRPAEPLADAQDHLQFHYEEHSCPTNWLNECVAVIEGDDADPHGFLKFVRAIDVPDDLEEPQSFPDWAALFPELATKETK